MAGPVRAAAQQEPVPVLTTDECMERLRARRQSSSHGCVPFDLGFGGWG
jgi:hypothetical protein